MCNVTIQCNDYSLNRQNFLFFCFNLLKSIIYLLSKFKFDINNKRDFYQLTEKLSREWLIIIQGFKNYKNLSKLSNSMIQNILNSNPIQPQNISITTVLFCGNLELLVLVLFYGKLVRFLFLDLRDIFVWFLHIRMTTYRIRTHSQVFQCF